MVVFRFILVILITKYYIIMGKIKNKGNFRETKIIEIDYELNLNVTVNKINCSFPLDNKINII